MPISPLIPCGGLATDPNPLVARGGMRIADDVIFERPGVAQPRPGWQRAYSIASPTVHPISMTSLPDGALLLHESDGASAWSFRVNASASALTGEAEPLDETASFAQFATARRNVYATTKKGPRKVTGSGVSAVAAAGMHEPPSGLFSIVSTGSPTVVPTNNATAYRWCFRKVDANALETRSPPSTWALIANNTGSTYDVQWIVPLPGYVAANDQIELYRSSLVTPYTATPSDVMYLALKHTVTSGEVSAGFATLTDRTPSTSLGQELYTNPTREGDRKSNQRPPASRAMTLWQDCMWFGGFVGPWTASIDIVTVTGATSTDGLTGLQRLQRTADSTLDSPTLTNVVGGTDSIKVGQLCTDAGTPGGTAGQIPIGARVLSKTATTVTLDMDATATEGGGTFFFHDGVTVDGLTYWASSANIVDSTYPAFGVTAGSREVGTARNLAYVISRVAPGVFAYAIEDPYYRGVEDGRFTQASVIVRSREQDDAQWSVSVVADTTSSPPAVIFEANASGGVLVSRDDFPNGVAYSKPDEPEHVPELNWFPIGAQSAPLYAFAPLNGALLAFKRDGIFRITGSAPDGWRVDLLEPDARIIRGECVDVLDGEAYAWTERGVLACNEGGARNISDGAVGRRLQELANVNADGAALACFVRTHPRRNSIVVGTPASLFDVADQQFVFNTSTRAWARWTRPLYCATHNPVDGYFWGALAPSGVSVLWDVRYNFEPYYGGVSTFLGYDGAFGSLTWVNASGSTTITITDAQRGAWTPKAGDWVSAMVGSSREYRRVHAASNTGSGYALTLASAFSAGSQTERTAYEGIVSRLQWNAFTVGTPAVAALVREVHPQLDWSSYGGIVGGGTGRLLVGASTNLRATITTQEWSADRVATPTLDTRTTMPTEVSRASHFYPYIETDDIGLDWRCDGIVMVYEGASEKGGR